MQRRASRKQKRSKNWEKAQVKASRLHHKIENTRKDWQLKIAHNLCDGADSIFVEDIDDRVMAKGFLGKHSRLCQFRSVQRIIEVGLLETRQVFCHSRPSGDIETMSGLWFRVG